MIEFFVLLIFVDDFIFLWINVGVVLLKKYFDGIEILKLRCIINI